MTSIFFLLFFFKFVNGGFYCIRVQIFDTGYGFLNGAYNIVNGAGCQYDRPYYKMPSTNLYISYQSNSWRIGTIACASGLYRKGPNTLWPDIETASEKWDSRTTVTCLNTAWEPDPVTTVATTPETTVISSTVPTTLQTTTIQPTTTTVEETTTTAQETTTTAEETTTTAQETTTTAQETTTTAQETTTTAQETTTTAEETTTTAEETTTTAQETTTTAQETTTTAEETTTTAQETTTTAQETTTLKATTISIYTTTVQPTTTKSTTYAPTTTSQQTTTTLLPTTTQLTASTKHSTTKEVTTTPNASTSQSTIQTTQNIQATSQVDATETNTTPEPDKRTTVTFEQSTTTDEYKQINYTKEPLEASCSIVSINEININEYRNLELFEENVVLIRKCHSGYEFEDHTLTRTHECIGTNVWHEMNATCQKIDCLRDKKEVDSRKETNIGYIQNFQTRCSHFIDLTCKKICPALPYWPLTVVKLNRIGSSATLSCIDGYHFENGVDIIHLSCVDGYWDISNVSTCVENLCENAPNFDFAVKVNDTKNELLSSVKYQCLNGTLTNFGYKYFYIKCSPNEEWLSDNITCSDNCPALTAQNFTVYNSSLTTKDTYVQVTCLLGYLTVLNTSSIVIKCQNRNWFPSLERPFCTRIKCPSRKFVEFSSLLWIEENYKYNVTCNDGYWIKKGITSLSISCDVYGKWKTEFDEIKCFRVDCGSPKVVQNSKSSYLSTNYNSIVSYNCFDGFTFKDTNNISTCLINGSWSFIDNCEIIKCPPIPVWDGVVCDKNSTDWGIKLNCSCQDGFKSKKNSFFFSTCRREWEPDIEQCIEVEVKKDEKTLEAPSAQHIGTVFGIVLGFIALVIVGMDLPHLCNLFQKKVKTKSLPKHLKQSKKKK
ncbi:DgyrCDS10003 [Dimorphilus gyrociliatus]|uniref:DgyrCDS10003 n=1 Tax=Dimorphilus gyrociliatus TaxID=2664684 RepID=A0A7I8VZ53_9ANNE|nr:DgyrCDS10003 [Dimorphilus gyrociliatus]